MSSLTTATTRLISPRSLLPRIMEEAERAANERKRAIGRRIAEARAAKRWKQKELAYAVNVEPLTVSRWETGRHMPDLDMLDLLAAALGVSAGWLLDGPTVEEEPTADAAVEGRLAALEEQLSENGEVLAELLRLVRRERGEQEPSNGTT